MSTKGEMTTQPRKEEDSTFGDYDLMIDKAWVGRIFGTCAKHTAKELVRRWNAFEKDGLVDELVKTYLGIVSIIGNVDHSQGHGENSAKMRGEMLIDIRDLVQAAIAKVS